MTEEDKIKMIDERANKFYQWLNYHIDSTARAIEGLNDPLDKTIIKHEAIEAISRATRNYVMELQEKVK